MQNIAGRAEKFIRFCLEKLSKYFSEIRAQQFFMLSFQI
jgi:hypothetical protein